MHKKILILSLFLLVCLSKTDAQLIANAGSNVTRCSSLSPAQVNPQLGGAPTATGGRPPYTYQWRKLPDLVYGAYLDNGSVANPTVSQDPGYSVDSLDYELIVTDDLNEMARDTVRVYFSHFTCTTGECIKFKNAADTVQLGLTCFARFQPSTYSWTPTQYLSATNVASPKSWTPVSQVYTAAITDSKGCIVYSSCAVQVGNTGIGNTVKNNAALLISPNPATAESQFIIDQAYLQGELLITSIDGKSVCKKKITSLITAVKEVLLEWQPGICFYKLSKPGMPVVTGKFLID
jgi:hypothetical protein